MTCGPTCICVRDSYPRPEEDEIKSENVWLQGHTDMSTMSLLWNQPVAGLQIMSPDGKWRWVRHIDNALVRALTRTSYRIGLDPLS